MKIRAIFLVFIATTAVSILFLKKSNFIESEENEQDGMEKAWRHEFLMTRDPRLNKIPVERLVTARGKMRTMMEATSSFLTREQSILSSLSWTERGPNNIGGRTRAILVDSRDNTNNTVWAGGVGGGLWKTTNFKSTPPTWTNVNDFFGNLAITCIKQSPTNPLEMYFGTGEGWGNVDAIDGLGIWKSTDGGVTWNQLSSTSSISYVLDIEFDANGYIYASTRSTVSAMRGILRSTDGGSTWTQVLTDPTATTTRGADLERGSNGDMYATLGIFSTGHIFRSAANGTNTGINGSWTEITPAGITGNSYQRTELAVCPNNSSRLYAVAQNSSTSGIGAMYRSDDNGVNWTSLANANWCDQGSSTTSTDFSRGQGWYDLVMAVDPNNSSLALVGGVVIVKTSNSGTAWSQMTRWASSATCNSSAVIHADIHEILFLNSNEIIVGNDGGIYYSSDGGSTFTTKNDGYNVTQYYSLALHPTSASNYMLAGAQDNGTHKFSTSGINTVTTATGGDGGFCFISQTNSNYQITSYTNATYSRSINGGSSWSTVVSSSNGRFINPADLSSGNILYFGYSDGSYGNYDVVNGGTNAISLSSDVTLTNLQASAIKADPNSANVIYIGFSTSETFNGSVVPKLVKVTNANGSNMGAPSQRPAGTEITLPASIAAGAYISSIDVESGNSSHILLTLSNYGVSSIWETTDAGVNWTSLDNNGANLPDMPVRWGMFIPAGYNLGYGATTNGIMLATELGVWTALATSGTTTTWTSNNSGVANVRADMLKLRTADQTFGVATHGRGIFTATMPTILPVTLVDFRGKLLENYISLDWITSKEINSKYFEIQKSVNGIDFIPVGRVTAAGNSTNDKSYNFKDYQVNEYNYYRLKTVDADGKITISKIILLKNGTVEQNIWIVNNPFGNFLDLRFAKTAANVKMQVITMNGAIIAEKQLTNPSMQTRWQLPGNLSTGTYIFRAFVDGKMLSSKVLKQ